MRAPADHGHTRTTYYKIISLALCLLLAPAVAVAEDMGRALEFGSQDSNDRVQESSFSGWPSTKLTVEFWVKTKDTGDEAIISYASSDKDNEFLLWRPKGLRVGVRCKGACLLGEVEWTNVAFNDGNWHHIAVTWDSSTGYVRVYKDGTLAYNQRYAG